MNMTIVNMAGTIGYGKSHILAVFISLLLKNPVPNQYNSTPFVCYIPDGRKLVAGEPAGVTAKYFGKYDRRRSLSNVRSKGNSCSRSMELD